MLEVFLESFSSSNSALRALADSGESSRSAWLLASRAFFISLAALNSSKREWAPGIPLNQL